MWRIAEVDQTQDDAVCQSDQGVAMQMFQNLVELL